MANSDLIVTKLRAKYSDELTTSAGNTFGDLWHLWSMEEASVPYLVGDALATVYGGTGDFSQNEFDYWTAFDPGDSGFDKFTVDVVNTVDNTIAFSRAEDGSHVVTGAGGTGGNDRRILYLDGSAVEDVEARLTFHVEGGITGLGQTGIVLRGADNGPAVTIWSNIVFAATGNVINGVWQYDGTTLLSINQMANTNLLYGQDIVNSVGGGNFVEVNTKGPHLASGNIIALSGVGSFGQVNVFDAPTEDQFRFQNRTVGEWVGGNYTYVIATRPRTLAVRLIGSTLTTKQWVVGHPEPEWDDPLRVEVNTIPAILANGSVPAPTDGLAGIVAAHLGNGSSITVRDFTLTNL